MRRYQSQRACTPDRLTVGFHNTAGYSPARTQQFFAARAAQDAPYRAAVASGPGVVSIPAAAPEEEEEGADADPCPPRTADADASPVAARTSLDSPGASLVAAGISLAASRSSDLSSIGASRSLPSLGLSPLSKSPSTGGAAAAAAAASKRRRRRHHPKPGRRASPPHKLPPAKPRPAEEITGFDLSGRTGASSSASSAERALLEAIDAEEATLVALAAIKAASASPSSPPLNRTARDVAELLHSPNSYLHKRKPEIEAAKLKARWNELRRRRSSRAANQMEQTKAEAASHALLLRTLAKTCKVKCYGRMLDGVADFYSGVFASVYIAALSEKRLADEKLKLLRHHQRRQHEITQRHVNRQHRARMKQVLAAAFTGWHEETVGKKKRIEGLQKVFLGHSRRGILVKMFRQWFQATKGWVKARKTSSSTMQFLEGRHVAEEALMAANTQIANLQAEVEYLNRQEDKLEGILKGRKKQLRKAEGNIGDLLAVVERVMYVDPAQREAAAHQAADVRMAAVRDAVERGQIRHVPKACDAETNTARPTKRGPRPRTRSEGMMRAGAGIEGGGGSAHHHHHLSRQQHHRGDPAFAGLFFFAGAASTDQVPDSRKRQHAHMFLNNRSVRAQLPPKRKVQAFVRAVAAKPREAAFEVSASRDYVLYA